MTDREKQLLRREGYVAAVRESGGCALADTAQRWAAEKFPLPKVTRPRTVLDPRGIFAAFRVIEGAIQYRQNGSTQWHDYVVDESRIRVWYDLLECPTEEVEDGGEL